MKRIIAFLTILCILMTSFACTAKPEPDPFTPLQNEFVSAVYPAKSINGLAIRWIHEDLIEALDGSSWVQKDSLFDQGGSSLYSSMIKAGILIASSLPEMG